MELPAAEPVVPERVALAHDRDAGLAIGDRQGRRRVGGVLLRHRQPQPVTLVGHEQQQRVAAAKAERSLTDSPW